MGERRGTRGLELWCRRMTEGYPGVKIDNMTTSWRDGLAFCAMIHHFRPDLIEFSKLNKDDIYYNNELAFRIAENHLGIPALLEPEDMVEYSIPDRLSILTYLSQFYQVFAVNQSNPNSPTKTPPKRPPPADLHMVSASSSSPPKKISTRLSGAGREPCAKCGLPVFIAERLNVGKILYHRTCFRCARCDSQLTLGNYYETENNGFCCETCPDEEKTSKLNTNILNKSLSDEEKTASLKGESDMYSSNFENVLEDSKDHSLRRNFTLDRVIGDKFTRAMTDFITTQVESDSDSDSESVDQNKPPDLPDAQLFVDSIKHSESIHLVSNNQLLPSFSDSDPSSFKVEDQNSDLNHESQHRVTKDSILAKEDPSSLSIRSRIRLFERDMDNKKSDVNKDVRLSADSAEVPLRNTSEMLDPTMDDSDSKHSKCEKSLEILSEESAISPTGDLSKVNTSARSDLYDADHSALNVSSQLSESNESYILISSETDATPSFVDVSNTEQLKVIENSVITISDVSEENGEYQQNRTEELEAEPDATSEVKIGDSLEYPDDLNPFGDEEDDASIEAGHKSSINSGEMGSKPKAAQTLSPNSTNPFEDDEDDDEVAESIQPQPMPRKTPKITLNPFGDEDYKPTPVPRSVRDDDKEVSSRRLISPKSTNPFEDDEDDDDEVADISVSVPSQPSVRKLVKAPKTSLTPLWKDEANLKPSPRSTRTSTNDSFETSSLTRSGRKKKPAPKPPNFNQELNESPLSSLTSSPSQSVCHSPKSTPKLRKMKRAPLPPRASTPLKSENSQSPAVSEMPSPIKASDMKVAENKPLQFRVGSEENLKSAKDELNRNMQQHVPLDEGPSSLPNKSTYGKWKRRKGQAPPRPIPHKRSIKSLPIEKIKHELDVIEVQQLGLEKQGVTLEKLIRERTEGPGSNEDAALAPEVEDMVLQLFELVNEKNELFRKQAELMYLRRQHRLEEEHAEVEYQIRCIMLQPEANKTDTDKAREEELISRLLEIVERRNEIVDCLEMDRRRAEDEDCSISSQMNLFSQKRDESISSQKKKSNKKEKHKHKKDKEKKNKSKTKIDADKDVDETETPIQKDKKKKKKFNLF